MTKVLTGENSTNFKDISKRQNNTEERWRVFDISTSISEKTTTDHITIFRNAFEEAVDVNGCDLNDPELFQKMNKFNPDFIIYQNLSQEKISDEIMAFRVNIENIFVQIYVPGLANEYGVKEIDIDGIDFTSIEDCPTADDLCEFVIRGAEIDNFLDTPSPKL
jgi:hypothetical protein